MNAGWAAASHTGKDGRHKGRLGALEVTLVAAKLRKGYEET